MSRMIITINFDNESDYKYVKGMPNSSHYIRELVKKERQSKSKEAAVNNIILPEKNQLKKALNAFD